MNTRVLCLFFFVKSLCIVLREQADPHTITCFMMTMASPLTVFNNSRINCDMCMHGALGAFPCQPLHFTPIW